MKQALLFAVLLTSFATPIAAGDFQTAAITPIRVGGSIPPPQKIKDVRPVSPAEWQRQAGGAEGIVTIDLTLGEDGRVRDAVVTHSIPVLDGAALDAVRQWEYRPTVVNGKPVPVVLTVTVNFPSQRALPPVVVAQAMIRLTSSRTPEGVTTTWEIPPSRASGLPRWNPETTAATLSVPEAVSTARTWLMQRNPQLRTFDLQNVALSRVHRGADVDFWYYQIDFFGYGATPQTSGPLFKAVILSDRSVVEPTQGGDANPAPTAYRPGNGVTLPRLLREVKANYTDEARRRKISGTVLVEGVVSTDGAFRNARVLRSLDATYGLDQAALDAAAQYQFAPGTRDGLPVPVMVTIEVTFMVK
jgi:TonB family protein